MRKIQRLIQTALFLILGGAVSVLAQTSTATLKVLVDDDGGRVIPGAMVTVTQTATGLKRTFPTDGGGQFIFTFLEPGSYGLEIRAQGFKSHQQSNLSNEIQTNNNYQIVTRVDYNISARQQLYGRLIKDRNLSFASGPFPGSIASNTAQGNVSSRPATVVLDYVNTLSPKVVFHVNAGATRFNNETTQPSDGFDPTSLGFPGYVLAASDDTRVFPSFAPTGYTALGPSRNFSNTRNNQDTFSFNQDVSILRGAHSIKLGANERVYRIYNFRPDDPAGNFTFNRLFTARTPIEAAQQTGDAIASFLLGNPASGRLGIAPQPAVQNLYYAFFAQDDWTVNRRLTLNIGLRWELDLPNTERYDRLTNFDPAGAFPVSSLNVTFPASTGLGARTIALRGVIAPVGRGGVENRENFDRDTNNLQRELPGDVIAQIAYAGSAGVSLLSGVTDLNQLTPEALALGATVLNTAVPNPFLSLPADQRPAATSILGRPTVTVAQLLRPYPQFGNVVSQFPNEAHSSYHSLQTKVSRRFSGGLAFTAAYTFSKLIDDISGIQISIGIQVPNYQNYYNRRADKTVSTFDVRHRFVGNLSYELPFGRDRVFFKSGVLSSVLGGFAVNAIVQAQSGFPLSVSAVNPALQGLAFIQLRPNLTADPGIEGASKADRIRQWFNTTAFQQPAPYTFGSAPRTLPPVRGPGNFATNLSIQRNFRFTDTLRFQLRAEGFNVFNRANFLNPGTVLGAVNFGVITATEDPRQFQIAAKLYF